VRDKGRDDTFEEDVAGFGMGGDTLEEGEGVADAV
jgi:hypothetical protein